MSQIVETRNGESVEVLDRGDINKFLIKVVVFLVLGGGGFVWTMAAQNSAVMNSLTLMNTRLTAAENTIYERRELVKQVDSLRITLREAITDLRRIR